MQDQKRAFVDRASDAATRSTHALLSPVSPYQVMAGTIIPAALVTGINSDLPGQVIATVTEAVYDSATGRHLLIPQGSRLLGQYDSQVAFGQRRVLLVWTPPRAARRVIHHARSSAGRRSCWLHGP